MVVYNGVIGVVVNNQVEGEKTKIYLKIHDTETGEVEEISTYEREGRPYYSREINGRLSVIIQHQDFTDLTWEISS